MTNPLPHTKRWWTPELTAMHKQKNRLAKDAYRWRGLPDHDTHQQHKEVSKEYTKLIDKSKKEHWEEWLLNASERDIWTANKYATDPPTDGGHTSMPNLMFPNPDGTPHHTTTNNEKSKVLARSFFPPPPPSPLFPPRITPNLLTSLPSS